MNRPGPLRWERWRSRAACQGLPLGLTKAFIAAAPLESERMWALGLCGGCPVKRECYLWAWSARGFEGIAGGRCWPAARRSVAGKRGPGAVAAARVSAGASGT